MKSLGRPLGRPGPHRAAQLSVSPNNPPPLNSILRRVLHLVLLPGGLYLILFVLLTDRLILRFSTRLWGVSQDVFQQAWTLWWVHHAVTQLHQHPLYTMLVEYPMGAWLWGHSLMLFNGALGIVLSPFLDLVQLYNTLVIFGFVASGVTAFWLSYYLTRATVASLVAGFIFTFSHYHFAHLLSHLDLVSMEWLPLFILCWFALLQNPNWKWGAGAGLSLGLVLWTHAYYFFYCLLAGGLVLGWFVLVKRDAQFLIRGKYPQAFAAFTIVALLTCGPLVGGFMWSSVGERIVGHDPTQNSLDLVALVVPARIWRFHPTTKPYWASWKGNLSETNAALPLAALAVAVGVWVKRRSIRDPNLGLWYILLLFFGVLSLGPVLHFNGDVVQGVPMPYALLETVLPPIRTMGVPGRMIVMSLLALAVINAFGLRALLRGGLWSRVLAVLVIGLIVIESLPTTIATMSPVVPAYVNALRALPDGAVLDRVGLATKPGIPPGQVMYFQTVHQKPIAFGYLSRVPAVVVAQNTRISEQFAQGQFDKLCVEFGLRYLVVPPNEFNDTTRYEPIYRDAEAIIFDLAAPQSLPNPIICRGSR